MNQRDMIVETYTIVKSLQKEMMGNGQPGLIKKVASIEGGLVLAKYVGGGGGLVGFIFGLITLIKMVV